MITLVKEDYGFRLTFVDPVTEEETARWMEDLERAVTERQGVFSVFVDLRGMELFTSESKLCVERVQQFCLANGYERSVVILGRELTEMQLKLIATASGIREFERYIVASNTPNWEEIGLNWVRQAIEPSDTVRETTS